ncbi:hypothetical protein LT011_17080 [Vibrio cholerae]|nr:hypothetical protein [Vibrio cholerae]
MIMVLCGRLVLALAAP